jgi:hypothetical protein
MGPMMEEPMANKDSGLLYAQFAFAWCNTGGRSCSFTRTRNICRRGRRSTVALAAMGLWEYGTRRTEWHRVGMSARWGLAAAGEHVMKMTREAG